MKMSGYLLRGVAAMVLLLVAGTHASAQTYGNEWVTYGNTYVKIPVAVQKLYRINKAMLTNMGMGNVPGNQFALYREGVEIPLYVSNNGTLGNDDFIEFYGTKANGEMDTQLYPSPEAQPSNEIPIICDTAYYFLTYNSSVHQRIEGAANNIPSNPPAALPYFIYESKAKTTRSFSTGYDISGVDPGHIVFNSSQFDQAEGYLFVQRTAGQAAYTIPRYTKHVYTGNPSLSATINVSVVANAEFGTHHTYIGIGNTNLFDTTYPRYSVIKKNITAPLSLLGSASTSVKFTEANKHGLSVLSITYPRTFDFATDTSYRTLMGLAASSQNQYLSFTNFATGGQAPVLFDLTNKKRYEGNIISATATDFYLPPAVTGRQAFISPFSEIDMVDTFYPVSFRNYTQSSNQGNYLIITHGNYINASPSYISQYKQYRESAAGGGYDVQVVDVQDLYNEFGYGFDYHPLGVKRFLKYAFEQWQTPPKFVFFVGKGLVYVSYLAFTRSPGDADFDNSLVPTYGHPGSDVLFSDFDGDSSPEIATGRLSARNNEEIGAYLTKVQAYENALKTPTVPNLENTLWKKLALHIAGGTDVSLQQNQLLPALNSCKNIYTDTLLGGNVVSVAKNSTNPIGNADDAKIDSVLNSGANVVTFFGHASSIGFDYNINEPNNYNLNPRFPLFFAFGCEVAHIFLTGERTIGEKYINSLNGGSVAMLAGNNFGYTGNLQSYMQTLYRKFCREEYGKTLGEQIQQTLKSLPNNPMMNVHKDCNILQGDPALALYQPTKPDYYTDDAQISAIPANVTTSQANFMLKAIVYNLGKATNDSVTITVEKTKAGNNTVLYADTVRIPLKYIDTVQFTIPIHRTTDVGLNVYTVKLNPDNKYDELSLQNNSGKLQLFIADNGLIPVYPYEFSIMHDQDITLKASALNLFAPEQQYNIEIDTTENFNSAFKKTYNVTGKGGIIKWKPNINYIDSTVYYWRTSSNELVNGELLWRKSSFIYLANGTDGWNQSHYYQLKRDEPYYGLALNASTRRFQFNSFTNKLDVRNRVIYPANNDYLNNSQSLNDVLLDNYGCSFQGTIQIVVFDSLTGEPWVNPMEGVAGSVPRCEDGPGYHNKYQFEFSYANATGRLNARNFLDSVPDGNYLLIKNLTRSNVWTRRTIEYWQDDSTTLGAGNTLYDKFIELGFDKIDSFNTNRTFIFFRKKGSNDHPIRQVISMDSTDIITLSDTFLSYPDTGMVTGTVIGPALKWNQLKWKTTSYGNAPQNDSAFVNIYGIDAAQNETLLYTTRNRDTSLSFINAATYPNIKLVWNSIDTTNRTSPHLNYWRVLYDPVPEAALNPLALYNFQSDTLKQGEKAKLQIAVENLTPKSMDSMLVKYRLIDNNNVSHDLSSKRYKKLPGNDTLIASLEFDPSHYTGNNILFVEANPDNDQPEQYHPNNLGYINFYVNADVTNPVMDVTFDGVHILDKDIVSGKPFIKSILLDENMYSALNDTAQFTMSLAYPDDPENYIKIPFDGTICKFIPADITANKKNQASIEFKPTLSQDGVYKLMIAGKDVAGNIAGSAAKYEISFTVENKPSITNVLNYPNPFSTSTAFVFTVTGSQVPSQFKIQIMTVTGKIVREITKDELGPLHIGRNITEYKWDGRDQFGQLLGNGVYLYRVVTSLNGNEIEHRSNAAVDKYFKHEFGKMYIMR